MEGFTRLIMDLQIVAYVLISIGALWGVLTLVSLREEEKYIQELIQAAEQAANKKRTRVSHGSE